jgi:hypothetical protein
MDATEHEAHPSSGENPQSPPHAETEWLWPAYPEDLEARGAPRETPLERPDPAPDSAEPEIETAASEDRAVPAGEVAASEVDASEPHSPAEAAQGTATESVEPEPGTEEEPAAAPTEPVAAEDATVPIPVVAPAWPVVTPPALPPPPPPPPALPGRVGWGPPPGQGAPPAWGLPPTHGGPAAGAPPAWGGPPARGAPPARETAYGWGAPAGWPGRRRRRGWIIALALLATVALLTVSVVGLGPALWGLGTSGPAATGPSGGTATSPAPAQRGGGATGRIDPQTAVGRVLSARGGAVLHHDRAAFLATVDRRRRTFYRNQAALFDRMITVPFSYLVYGVSPPGRDLATPPVRRHYAPSQVYLPEVEVRYRFRGQDSSPVTAHQYYTFVLTSAGWRIAGEGDLASRQEDVELWDSAPVRNLATARTLVVYHPGDQALAERLLSAAELGYGQVAASWSGTWDHKVVILLPRDQGEAERLVHGRDLSDVAAVASSQIEEGPAHRVLGNRVIVNTSVIGRYDRLNLQVVITHEMTHVATRKVGVGVPLFLVEGFADFTALQPVDAPLRITRPALADAVRAGRFQGRLPSDDDLRGSDAALAYDEGSSFCLWVARTFSEAKLQSLYRSFSGVEAPTPRALDQRMRRVLGISRATAESRWAAFVRQAL